jgi:hypothetical protein
MRGVRFFGNLALHRSWIETSGWNALTEDSVVDRMLICTFDNQSLNPLERLEGTIGTMRDAMTLVQKGGVERVVLVTDGAGYAGSRKISNAPQSATFIDAHGMGCLTSEVLANIAIKAGSQVTIIYGEAHADERVRQAVLDALD